MMKRERERRNSGTGLTRRRDDSVRLRNCIQHARVWIAAVGLQLMLLSGVAHAQSTEDGFNPGANIVVNAFALQPDGKLLVGGGFSELGGQPRSRIGRLKPDGKIDDTFIALPNDTVYAVAVLPGGKILIGGQFTQVNGQSCTGICRLRPDGGVDRSFNAGANGTVYTIVLQPDGKIVVGGGAFTPFTQLGGQTRLNIGRLNQDGTLDTTFNPGADGPVEALAVQPDGKIVVGGFFSQLGGQSRSRIGRLNLNGTLDTNFDPGATGEILSLAVDAGGKIVVAGFLVTLGGRAGTGIGRLNEDGSLDSSFNGSSDGFPKAVALQPDGRILVGGSFTQIDGQPRSNVGRLNPDGSLDSSFNPGANNQIFALAVQTDGNVVFGGVFTQLGGQPRNCIARVNSDATADSTFNPAANGTVETFAVQADGKILVGGSFGQLGGQTRLKIGRLNADGSLDTTFNPGASGTVNAFVVQPDGKIIVGGSFNQLGGQTRLNIGRLNADGTLDNSFNPGTLGAVFALALQPDGKIIVGGELSQLGGQSRGRIGRLNPNGTLDTSFNPSAQSDSSFGAVNAVAVLVNGQIMVGGDFSQINGQARDNIARLQPDGTLDVVFNPGAGSGFFDSVSALVVQPDGKIVIGGLFSQLGGQSRLNIGRLNRDGSLDSFNPGANGVFAPVVHSLAIQADGKILVGGTFNTLGGVQAAKIGRLNTNGTRDFSFVAEVRGDTAVNDEVNALALQPDGKILIGGLFTSISGQNVLQTRNNIGRLTNTSAALQNLSVESSTTVTWSRGGASPEFSRVTFELSTDGFTYAPLGEGTPITDGWQLTGISLPQHQNLFIRARGFYATGAGNGAGSFVESVRHAFVTVACITLSINPATLPGGTINTPYGQVLTASGGDGPYTFAVVPTLGALPAGLTLDPSTGLLSGTPTRSGINNFTVIATDTIGGCIGRQAYTIVIDCTPITFSPASLPSGVLGVTYSQTITANGANNSFTYALTGQGFLPLGLTLDSSTGVISGTPLTAGGTFNFTVTATDTVSGCSASHDYGLTVDCTPITLSPSSLPNGAVGVPYSQTISASGFDSSFFFIVTFQRPPGLTIDESTGVLSGTPSVTGTYNFKVFAIGRTSGCEGQRDYSITVDAAPAPVLAPAGLSLVNESCPPFNRAVDPGERVTFSLGLMNNGPVPTSNLIATLQSSENVIAPSNPQTYEILAASGGTAARDFSFTAAGSCGETLPLTLRLQDGATDLGMVTYVVKLGPPNGTCATQCSMARLIVTSELTRVDAITVKATYRVQNIGVVEASDLLLTTAQLGAALGAPLPQGLSKLLPGQVSDPLEVVFHNSTAGASSMLTLGGVYAEGSFTSTRRVTIP